MLRNSYGVHISTYIKMLIDCIKFSNYFKYGVLKKVCILEYYRVLHYRSEKPGSPSLLDKLEETLFVKLDRNESLKLLCTLIDGGTSKEGCSFV